MAVGVLGSTAPQQYEQLFTSSGTWTKPAGVKTCEVKMIGGAGAPISGGSSGAGGYWSGILDVSNVSSVPVTVGSAASSGDGGTSVFGNFMAAAGSPAGTTNGSSVGGVINIGTQYAGNVYGADYYLSFGSATIPNGTPTALIRRAGNRIFYMGTNTSGQMNQITFFDMDLQQFVTQAFGFTVYPTNSRDQNASYANGVWFLTGFAGTASNSTTNTRILYSTDGATWNQATVSYATDSGASYGASTPYFGAVRYVNGYYVVSRTASNSSSTFMYASSPSGPWSATGPGISGNFGSAMFYNSTYSVYVAVISNPSSTSTDDNYVVYTNSAITGTWTQVATVSVGAGAINSPALEILEVGGIIQFFADSTSTTTGTGSTNARMIVDRVEITSATTATATSNFITYNTPASLQDSPAMNGTFFDGTYLYYATRSSSGVQMHKVELLATSSNRSSQLMNSAPLGLNGSVPDFRYTPLYFNTLSNNGYYTWPEAAGGTFLFVLPKYYSAGAATTSSNASPGIGGPATLTNSSTTTYFSGGPGIDGWGIGGGLGNTSSTAINTSHGYDNYGSGANGTALGRSGAVLVRWWK